MTDMQNALSFLEEMRQEHLSIPVKYVRGNDELEISASQGRTNFRIEDSYGQLIRYQSCDFLISAALLPFEPEAGDQIILNGDVFEVMAPASEPCWRWINPHRTTYRIHTKQVALQGT